MTGTNNSYSGATTINGGSLVGGAANAFSAASVTTVNTGGTLDLGGFSQTINAVSLAGGTLTNGSLSGAVTSTGGTIDGLGGVASVTTTSGTTTASGSNTYTGATTINGGTLALSGAGSIAASSGVNLWTGATFDISNSTAPGVTIKSLAEVSIIKEDPAAVVLGANTLTLSNASGTFGGTITGTGGLTLTAGTETLTGTNNSYSGATTINGGSLQVGNGGTSGQLGSGAITNNATLTFNRSDSFSVANALAGAGTLNKQGAGMLTYSGAGGGYTGTTNVDAGTLAVNGALGGTTNVNTGGTLGGTGTLDTVNVRSGGTLAPGNSIGTITIDHDLSFDRASTYAVEVSSSGADRTNVGGTASLAGTVNATFAPGNYGRHYKILSATGGFGGTTFDTFTTSLPANFNVSLSYAPNDVLLNLTAALGRNSALNPNQQAVANVLDGYFNDSGALPPQFLALYGLGGGALASALTQLSGESATGAQQSAFQLGSQFLGVMFGSFMAGSGEPHVGGGALGFAPERAALPEEAAKTFAKALHESAVKGANPSFERRWNAWASAYGGYSRIAGDAAAGAHDVGARATGVAAGADYWLTPATRLGFALAGGGTNWSLSNGIGSGRSDALQAGGYGITHLGPAYIAGALAFTNYWMSTDRTAFAGDQLAARFDAQSYSARLEAGYRFAMPLGTVKPYAAVQAQSFHLPSYSEEDRTGGGFGLSFAAKTATATRSELGARFEHVVAAGQDAVLSLRGKLAWAHDWMSNRAVTAAFQALPGASFIVTGATPASDVALASAGLELQLANGIALIGKFDGEFAAATQTYAGTGILRLRW